MKLRAILLTCGLTTLVLSSALAEQTTSTATAATTGSGAATAELQTTVSPCEPLPKGKLSDEQLKQLVPDNSPGRVFIRWRTETQEDNYGFHIYRGVQSGGPYKKINKAIIPGEGSTNIPMEYCYMDVGLPRGQVFYYQIESISNAGVAEIMDLTRNTRVKVKTVAEEREWLRNKALGIDTRTTATAAATTVTAGAGTTPASKQPNAASPNQLRARAKQVRMQGPGKTAANTTSPLD